MSILEAGFVAALPAICGCIGGVFSDYLLNRCYSLSVARKKPIIVGMLLCTSMVICNYTASYVVVAAAMSLAFFGKGIGALGWTVNADTASAAWIARRRASLVPLRRHSGPPRCLRHYRPAVVPHTAADDHQNWPDPGRSFRKCSSNDIPGYCGE